MKVSMDKNEKFHAVCRHEGFRLEARYRFIEGEDGFIYLKTK